MSNWDDTSWAFRSQQHVEQARAPHDMAALRAIENAGRSIASIPAQIQQAQRHKLDMQLGVQQVAMGELRKQEWASRHQALMAEMQLRQQKAQTDLIEYQTRQQMYGQRMEIEREEFNGRQSRQPLMWDEQAGKPYRNILVDGQAQRKYFSQDEWDYQEKMRKAMLEERQGKAEYEKRRGSGEMTDRDIMSWVKDMALLMVKRHEAGMNKQGEDATPKF